MNTNSQTHRIAFVPTLYMKDLTLAIAFYKSAFGATERWRIENEGRVHVAEMCISSVVFRMHEEVARAHELSPAALRGTSIILGLLTDDPDAVAARALAAGATELSPVQEYEYGYRQGTISDPFGHHWCLEQYDDLKKIPAVN